MTDDEGAGRAAGSAVGSADRSVAGPAMATWQALCMDATNHTLLGGFWAATLGLSPADATDGSMTLQGDQQSQQVWIDPVPEPRSVKHRIHLDVELGALKGVESLGATIVREPTADDHWWVMADPEGGEFCAFLREGRPSLPGRLYEVVVDCVDAVAQAAWWREVFGLAAEGEPAEHHAALEGGGLLPFDYLCFVDVPEPKVGKNRVHWDVRTADVAALVDHGAKVLREPGGDISWHVLADPEGNEFCAFPAT